MPAFWPSIIACLLLAGATQAAQPPRGKNARPTLDQFGDPLPQHAVLQIGTSRLRPSGTVTAMAFTRDAKRLVTGTMGSGIQVWEVATGKELLTLDRPKYQGALAVSSDGSRAAVLVSTKVCKVFDTTTGKVIATLQPNWSSINALCFSPDNSLLACAGGGIEKFVSVWNVNSGTMVKDWPTPEYYTKIAISPDNKLLAHSGPGLAVGLCEIATGKMLREIGARLSQGYQRLHFSLESAALSAMTSPSTGFDVFRWHVATGNEVRHFQSPGDASQGGFTPDGEAFTGSVSSAKVVVWDVDAGKPQRVFAGPKDWAKTSLSMLALSADGKLIAASWGDYTVRIADFESGKPLHDFMDGAGPGEVARFTADGKGIISHTRFWRAIDTYKLWDAHSGKLLRDVPASGKSALSGNGQTLIITDTHGSITAHRVDTREKVREFSPPRGSYHALPTLISDEGRYLATSGARNGEPRGFELPTAVVAHQLHHYQVWDIASGKLRVELEVAGRYDGQPLCAFTPDGQFFAAMRGPDSSADAAVGSLSLWDLRTGRKVSPSPAWMPADYLGVFSPTGRLMAWLPRNGKKCIEIRELATGKLVCELWPGGNRRIPNGSSDCLAFSPDGMTVAAATHEDEILLWNIFSEEPVARLPGHRGGITSLGFSPDGNRLVTGGFCDATILVWDVSPWTRPRAKPAIKLGKDAVEMWQKMARENADDAYSAINQMLQSPSEAVACLSERMKPAPPLDFDYIANLIAALDSNRFGERNQAMAKLERLGSQAQMALEKTLAANPPLEVRQRIQQLLAKLHSRSFPAEWLQPLRALELLEMLGTPDAIDLLEAVAGGAPNAWLTQEAGATLARAKKRAGV